MTALAGVGPKVAERLGAVGLSTLADLVMFFPRRVQEVVELQGPDEEAVDRQVRLAGRIESVRHAWLPGRRSLVKVELTADDGQRFEVPFFNQPYLRKSWKPGDRKLLEGRLGKSGKSWRLVNPRVLANNVVAGGACQVRYKEIEGFSEERLRSFVQQALQCVRLSALPVPRLPDGLAEEGLDQQQAVRAMHLPASVEEHERARRYFALHEALAVFRRVEASRRERQGLRGPVVQLTAEIRQRVAKLLPFEPTGDQARVVEQMTRMLRGPAPMGVLLQGDVGTGKTVVALFAALAAVASGYQVAFLAPTELLAEQHFDVLQRWLAGTRVRLHLLTASLSAADRRGVQESLATAEPLLVVGTHSLISEQVEFGRLGLVIVDEQHRFGVRQRVRLLRKGTAPHVLFMTATPIPRTLCFTLFGDLQLMELRQKPPGHHAVRSFYLEPKDWPRLQSVMAAHLRRGGKVFVVCPKIGDAETKGSAVRLHQELATRLPAQLVHGQMKAEQRQAVVEEFRRGPPAVLVGTTVLEVGVDVPAATLMVVVQAERFGLATLHQLRGRVGRGTRRGICVLTGEDTERVRAVCKTSDGFALAEEDLRLRGAGELLGTRQSGLSDLLAFDPLADLDLLLRARRAVVEVEEQHA